MNCALSDHAVCMITAPAKDLAELIAVTLVEKKLAACCTIIPGATSFYTWEGAIEKTDEIQIFAKTRTEHVTALIEAVKALHPYQVPEIIFLPISAGLPAYLNWIDDSVQR